MSRNKNKADPLSNNNIEPVTDASDKPEIRDDRILKLMMRTGIPLALISVLSLWASNYLGSAGIGLLFFITAALALLIGFAYNIRYVMLLVRQRRQPPQDK
ncbi:MAG: hypothetical protein V7629_00305 [Motiliproteus sp.]